MMNNENGRSMVEMLGVLAIIGVLSVAGIAGYSMAMRKYRANEIVNVASQLVVLAQAQDAGNGGIACTKGVAAASCKVGTTTGVVTDLPDPSGLTLTADCTGTKCKVTSSDSTDEAYVAAQNQVGTNGNGTYYNLS